MAPTGPAVKTATECPPRRARTIATPSRTRPATGCSGRYVSGSVPFLQLALLDVLHRRTTLVASGVTIISTPGHTPGHQSLLVKLPKTGAVVLSGDAAHFKSNWDNRRVPSINWNKEKTLASMQRITDILVKEHAQLWINHDKAQTDTLKHAPDFYE